jgi:hypothetical protein
MHISDTEEHQDSGESECAFHILSETFGYHGSAVIDKSDVHLSLVPLNPLSRGNPHLEAE